MARRDRRLLGFARQMRSQPTSAEDRLWYHLRAKRLGGYKFRRQEPIGPYIADFACHQERVIIEIDGDTHSDRRGDRSRDHWFHHHGWFVLRFWDHYVLEQMDDTLGVIMTALQDPTAVIDPLNDEG